MTDLVESLREAPFGPESVADEPLAQFRAWYADAERAGVLQPDAMHLATADKAGRPSVRVVLYKDPDQFGLGVTGIPFFTNLESPKSRTLIENPEAAISIHWSLLGRQIRFWGAARPLPAEGSDRYFASRPEGSKQGAWASPQSQPIGSREELMARVEEVRKKYAGKPVPRPPFWGGYCLDPREVEFWQHRDDRLHDRVLYTRGGDGKWARKRLAP